jgi:hypothetical protein
MSDTAVVETPRKPRAAKGERAEQTGFRAVQISNDTAKKVDTFAKNMADKAQFVYDAAVQLFSEKTVDEQVELTINARKRAASAKAAKVGQNGQHEPTGV